MPVLQPIRRPSWQIWGKVPKSQILRGIGEFDIVENGINMSKRRSQAASSTVFFAFWILWMHCVPLFGQYGCMYTTPDHVFQMGAVGYFG